MEFGCLFLVSNAERLRELLTFTVSVITTGLFVATAAAKGPSNVGLIVILAIASVTMMSALAIKYKIRRVISLRDTTSSLRLRGINKIIEAQILRPSYANMVILHSASITLIIFLIARLSATNRFGGWPANLDFGPKISKGEISADSNLALTGDMDSFGHFIQGFLACLFSFPAINGIFAKMLVCCRNRGTGTGNDSTGTSFWVKHPNVDILLLLQLSSACMTIYPTYNLIKRLIKDSEYFSRTSYANNMTEWVLGYVLAIGIGWLVSAIVQYKLLSLASLISSTDEEAQLELLKVEGRDIYGFGSAIEYIDESSQRYRRVASTIITITSNLLLILLSISTLLAGIFYGLTWNYDDSIENFAEDYELVIAFVAVYAAIVIAMLLLCKVFRRTSP
mmetsp:Transcript_5444/g.5998  ORF Transcript_5444/g.5998 Transcript_5444/m.5998 type:complete len:394 (+) Transcript_5444:153-1334(+)